MNYRDIGVGPSAQDIKTVPAKELNPCDYLGHIPVKMFHGLDFYCDGEDSYFYSKTGKFRRFMTGQEVPTRSLYYKYPDTMQIITYGDDRMLLFIEDAAYQGIVDIGRFDPDIGIFDIYGNKLKVQSVSDILAIKAEFGKEGTPETFISKWVDDLNRSEDLLVFGRYLEMFQRYRIDPDTNDFKWLVKKFKSFLELVDIQDIKNRYKQWLEDESYIPYKDIDSIIKYVNNADIVFD